MVDNALVPAALFLVLAATAVPFLLPHTPRAMASYRYVYAAGAVILLLARLFTPFRGKDLRLRRLHRIEAWSAIFFCAGCAFMFIPGGTGRDWIAFTLAGAAIQIFTSIAIPRREASLGNGKKDS